MRWLFLVLSFPRTHAFLHRPRRREIEAFLTGYVQSLSGSADGSPSASSSSRALASESLDPTSAIDYSEATSSLGADLRSLRSSEKETLKSRAAGKERRARSKGSSGGSGAARCGEVRNGDAVVDSPLHPRDPPAILRRPTDIFPPDLDYLAAPSFSGAEPRSLTGTGAGMRISDPSSKRRKRRRSDEPSGRDETPLPPSMSYRNTMAREDISDPDKLEATIVEWVERVFFDALPVEGGGDDVEFETSTNTAYLRALLTSDETLQQGGWLYVNLIATFASLQRLNVTVTLIRHALRRSKLVELSEDGAKIRWRGPSTKPAVEAGEAGGCAFEMDGNNVESMQLSSRRRESGNGPEYQSNRSSSGGRSRTLVRRGLGSLDDDTTATGGSTVPTSQHASDQPKLGGSSNQRSEEQDASHTRSSHPRPRPSPTKPSLTSSHSSSSLQPFTLTLRTPPEPLGSVPASTKHLYKPLIFRPLSSPSSDGSIAGEAVSEGSVTDEDGGVRPAKRSRTQEGGVLFFANDLFFSDLAGDSYQRVREAVAQKEDEGEEGYESILGESTTTHDAAPSRSSGLREGSFEEEVAMEVEPWELSSFPEPAGGAVDKLDAMGEWSEIEELVVFDSPSPPVDGDEYHPLLDLPLSHLRVSGMSDVTAADHFSLRIKLLHPSSAASSAPPPNSSPRSRPPLLPPTLLSSHIIHHHPSICPRFPRVRMRFSSTSSDADSEDQPQPSDLSPTLSDVLRAEREHGDGLVGDYLTSLALPMPWAPGRQYSDSDEQGSGAMEEDEQEELVVL